MATSVAVITAAEGAIAVVQGALPLIEKIVSILTTHAPDLAVEIKRAEDHAAATDDATIATGEAWLKSNPNTIPSK